MFTLLKQPIFIGIIVLAILSAIGGVYFKGYANGSEKQKNLCNVAKTEAINENLQIKEKQERVIRPSDATLIDSLRRETF